MFKITLKSKTNAIAQKLFFLFPQIFWVEWMIFCNDAELQLEFSDLILERIASSKPRILFQLL